LDDGIGAARPRHGDRLEVDALVRFDDEYERSLLTSLNRGRGRDDRIGVGVQPDVDVHKLSGPQSTALIRERAFDPDGPSGWIDGVVDERDPPDGARPFIIWRGGFDAQRTLRHVALQVRQLRFRNSERDIDRGDLVDDN